MNAQSTTRQIARERESLLERFHVWLGKPMLVRALVWLALFVIEVVRGLSPLLQYLGDVIWVIFVIEFVAGFILAPRKLKYLKENWLKAISLAAPALRLFRIVALARAARAVRAARGLRLLRVVASVNRSMKALGSSLGRRGFGYVGLLSVIVLLAGAAGMYAFEGPPAGANGLKNYADALWWTTMVRTTLGSEYWPKSPEGRLICLFLAIYAITVFGYMTAALASFFVDRDAADDDCEVAGQRAIVGLRDEIAKLREDVQALARHGRGPPEPAKRG